MKSRPQSPRLDHAPSVAPAGAGAERRSQTSEETEGTLPDLSIIIVNRNTRDFLERCLASIRDIPDRLILEIVVVDNASSDGSPEMVEAEFPNVHLIRNAANTGFAAPNNQGIAWSTGRHVMLLNSDTVVLPRALERLVAYLDANPRVGACGPKLRYPDGRIQPSCFNFHSPWRAFCDLSGLATVFPRSGFFGNLQRAFDHDRTAPTESLMGAALVVRREVVDAVGMLDERFRIHSNEVDWCYRMHRAGWERHFVAEAEIVHELGGTLRSENEDLRLQGEMVQNLFDFHRKHFGRSGLLWFRFWCGLGYTVRAIWYPVRNRFRPSAEGRRLARLAPGMVRAAWAGSGRAFGGHGSTEGD